MEVANQENHLVNDAFVRIMSVSSDRHIAEVDEPNGWLQDPNNQKPVFHSRRIPTAKMLQRPQTRLYARIIYGNQAMECIVDVCHLGRNTHRDQGVHQHLLRKHLPRIPVPR